MGNDSPENKAKKGSGVIGGPERPDGDRRGDDRRTDRHSLDRTHADLARAQVEHRKPGRPDDEMPYHIRRLSAGSADGGTGSSYLLRRLARDHEPILAAYEAGEYASVRAAAIAAGQSIQTLTPVIVILWLTLSLVAATKIQRARYPI